MKFMLHFILAAFCYLTMLGSLTSCDKEPDVIKERKRKGVIMGAMTAAAQRTADMRDDDPTVDYSSQPLEALMHMITQENLLRRLFHQGPAVTKKANSPAVHVLFCLFSEHR